MKVPLLDLAPQLRSIEREVKQAVEEVIDSTRYVGGPKVEALESAIADYVGTRHAVAVSSGTDALLCALMALEVGPGDLVLTTAYSFFATASTITRLHATPVFLDIDPETYNLCPGDLEDWIRSHPEETARVKAVVPAHLFGQCADMDPLLEITGAHGIAVVEDAAQAMGALYPSAAGPRRAGAMGAMGCFSFFPSKNLGAMGDGGMVTTDDDSLAERLRGLRDHCGQSERGTLFLGGNFRLDPIQAAVLLVKLPHLEEWNRRRRRNAAHYDARLASTDIATPAIRWSRDHHTYSQYVVSVPDRRDELAAHLTESGIGHQIYYPTPFHHQACFRDLDHRRAELPGSEYAARHSIAIPIYPELTDDMLDYVAQSLCSFYGRTDPAHDPGSQPG